MLTFSCASQSLVKDEAAASAGGVTLDAALSDIAAYYTENLNVGARIVLAGFEADARLLADYIFEELWIRFEDSGAFVLVDRQNLELTQKELEYQYSGNVSDESAQAIGRQFGPQTLVGGDPQSMIRRD